LLGNALVLIAPKDRAKPVTITKGFDLAGLIGDSKLAMALVDSVPAGIYGKEALTNLGDWQAVSSKVAQAANVRAALALVASGEAAYGITYATDAVAEPRVSVVGTFPETSHKPIIYPAAVTTNAPKAAVAFLAYLSGPRAKAEFEKQGFTVLPQH
ncbi:molybdate ABC transporter substrate-binding protein, partial [Thioclava sp. BHET1]